MSACCASAEGIDGLGDRPGAGGKRRLSETERSAIVALVATPPPGRLERQTDGALACQDESAHAQWSLDSLAEAAQGAGHHRPLQPAAPHHVGRESALAARPLLGAESGSGLRPKRTAVVTLYTTPPGGATVLCVDALGPLTPRTFPPAAGWSRDGHRIKAPLEYSRGQDKVWVYGALRIRDGQALTLTAPACNTVGYLGLLEAAARANPEGTLYLITDNLSSHSGGPIQA